MLLAVALIVVLALSITICIKKCVGKGHTEVELTSKNSDVSVLARLHTLSDKSSKYAEDAKKTAMKAMADEMNKSESKEVSQDDVEVNAGKPDFKVENIQ